MNGNCRNGHRMVVHAVMFLVLFVSMIFTGTASAMGTAAIPVVPTGVTATDGDYGDHVQVNWTPIVDATYYEVYRSDSDDSSLSSLLASPAAAPYDDMTAIPGTTYWYFVKACNLDGCSDFSASDSGYSALAIPAVPSDVAASDGTFPDKVQVTWTAVSDAAYYEVYRNSSNDSSTAALLASPASSPYDDLTAVPGTLYWYFLKACNSSGCSDFSLSDTGYAGTLTVTTAEFTSIGAQDGWVLERTEKSNKGGYINPSAAILTVGDSRADKQFRSILSFDTSALPDNAFITAITLEIRRNRVIGRNPFFTHGNLTADIASPYFGTSEALAREDFQAAPGMMAAATFGKRPDSAFWYSAVVNPMAYSYINLVGTTQFRLRFTRGDDDDLRADLLRFFSGNGPAQFRPALLIEYYAP